MTVMTSHYIMHHFCGDLGNRNYLSIRYSFMSLLRRKRTPSFFPLRPSFLSGKLKICDKKIHSFSSRMTKEVMWTGKSNSLSCQSLF